MPCSMVAWSALACASSSRRRRDSSLAPAVRPALVLVDREAAVEPVVVGAVEAGLHRGGLLVDAGDLAVAGGDDLGVARV
jgi:hypothetical protein